MLFDLRPLDLPPETFRARVRMNPASLARELSDLAKHAASAAKGMHARGDANGGHYNDGRWAAFVWLAFQLDDPESHLMRKLREEVKP